MYRRKKRIADPYYKGINEEQIPLYQKYLDEVFPLIDIDNYTLWSKSKEHNRDRLKQDRQLMEKVFCEEAASHGLSPVYLQIMVNQYVFADPWSRERYRSIWAETVVYNQEKIDFFPGALNVRRLLEAVS